MAALPELHACSAITAYTTACMTSPEMHPWATSAYQWPAWVTHTRCSHNAMQQSMTPLLLRAHKHQLGQTYSHPCQLAAEQSNTGGH